LQAASHTSPNRDLAKAIARLAQIRRCSSALKYGNCEQISVKHEQLAFVRQTEKECVICIINAADEVVAIDFDVPQQNADHLVDLLSAGDSFVVVDGKAHIEPVWSCWARILVAE
jgi:hypothetical protein